MSLSLAVKHPPYCTIVVSTNFYANRTQVVQIFEDKSWRPPTGNTKTTSYEQKIAYRKLIFFFNSEYGPPQVNFSPDSSTWCDFYEHMPRRPYRLPTTKWPARPIARGKFQLCKISSSTYFSISSAYSTTSSTSWDNMTDNVNSSWGFSPPLITHGSPLFHMKSIKDSLPSRK